MLKVLIADDEPKIRRKIIKSIEWEELELEMVAEAEDGEIALKYAVDNQVDIVLVDICMPFLNGLQLIERLNSELEEALIIIISGHDEFKYAQSAIKLGVFEYLLKPVDSRQLREVLMRAKTTILQRRLQAQSDNVIHKEISKNKQYLQEQLIASYLDGTIKKEQFEQRLEYYGIRYKESIGMVLIKAQNNIRQQQVMEYDLTCYCIENIIYEIMSEFTNVIVSKCKQSQFVVLSDIVPIVKWQQVVGTIENNILKYLKEEMYIEISVITEGIENIQKTYKELCINMEQKNKVLPIVKLVKLYIEGAYSNPMLTLGEVAEHVKISEAYLSKLVKQELGVSFVEYLTHVRIRKAMLLLREPSMAIYEVAESVGYSTQHYFSTVFKKTVGISPVEYRKGGREKCLEKGTYLT